MIKLLLMILIEGGYKLNSQKNKCYIKDDKKMMLNMYQQMLSIRRFEEEVIELYKQGTMPGMAHLYIGEEAVAVGSCNAINKKDYISSTHRGHGHLIAKGGDLKKMMSEILGKKTGYCKGKGGSQHIADFELGMLGANGIVAGGVPIAVGAALTSSYLSTGTVTLSFFGDGATNQGSFHESVNLAATWKLPVIFICENNQYGISVSQARHQTIKDIAVRAEAYGIPGEIVDGMDVLAVYKSTQKAVERARQGEGPTLLECKTYRYTGHHVGDPGYGSLYRSPEEIEKWKQRCPIKKMRGQLIDNNVCTEEEIVNLENEVERSIAEAVSYAKESPYPEEDELMKDIYA